MQTLARLLEFSSNVCDISKTVDYLSIEAISGRIGLHEFYLFSAQHNLQYLIPVNGHCMSSLSDDGSVFFMGKDDNGVIDFRIVSALYEPKLTHDQIATTTALYLNNALN